MKLFARKKGGETNIAKELDRLSCLARRVAAHDLTYLEFFSLPKKHRVQQLDNQTVYVLRELSTQLERMLVEDYR